MSKVVLELLQKLQTAGDVADDDLAALTNEEYGALLREWREKKWREWLGGRGGGGLFGSAGQSLPPERRDFSELARQLSAGGALVHPAGKRNWRSDQK